LNQNKNQNKNKNKNKNQSKGRGVGVGVSRTAQAIPGRLGVRHPWPADAARHNTPHLGHQHLSGLSQNVALHSSAAFIFPLPGEKVFRRRRQRHAFGAHPNVATQQIKKIWRDSATDSSFPLLRGKVRMGGNISGAQRHTNNSPLYQRGVRGDLKVRAHLHYR